MDSKLINVSSDNRKHLLPSYSLFLKLQWCTSLRDSLQQLSNERKSTEKICLLQGTITDRLGTCHLPSTELGSGSAKEVKTTFNFPIHKLLAIQKKKKNPCCLTKPLKWGTERSWTLKSLQLLFSRKKISVKHSLLLPTQHWQQLKGLKRCSIKDKS